MARITKGPMISRPAGLGHVSSGRGGVAMPLLAIVLLFAMSHQAAAQWPPDSITNLRVLPRTIPFDSPVGIMGGFTRALGVRCSYCHVGQEGAPLSSYNFASDEREPKRKARVMLRMVHGINQTLAADLTSRVTPPVTVECATCHRGVTQPRSLEATILHAYDTRGLDSALAAYRALRETYYGRAAFDFGSVPLADVAGDLERRGRLDDAVAFAELNATMNPASPFAARTAVRLAVTRAFRAGQDGPAVYRAMIARHGANAVSEDVLNRVGYQLLGDGRAREAVAAFRLNAEQYPDSWNAHDSLCEGLEAAGEIAQAIASCQRSVALNPRNTAGAERLRRLRARR